MIRRILVPLDGSERATRAMPFAAQIARETGARLELVCVFDLAMLYAPTYAPIPIPQNAIDEQEEALRAYLNGVASKHELAGLPIDVKVLTGPVAATLLRVVESEQVDLVVLNSHGRGGAARWLLGSVAEHLVHFATVPLLILRDSPEAADPSPVASGTAWQALIGWDGSAFAEEAIAPTAQVIQALSGTNRGRLHLVSVERPVSDADDLEPVLGSPEQLRAAHELVLRDAATALAAIAQRVGTQYPALDITSAVVEHRDPAAALIDLAEQHATTNAPGGVAYTLIGIATHGRRGLARWTLGSVTYRVLEGSHVPLVIVRPQAIAQQQQATREHLLHP